MKNKFYKISAIAAVALSAVLLLSSSKTYSPRQTSFLTPNAEHAEEYKEDIKGYEEEIDALRVNQLTGTVSFEDYQTAVKGLKQAQLRRVAKDFDWEELGPDNVGGRTRALLIDRNNPNIMYAGGVSGGLWKSTTRGTSWKKINDDQENLNVVSITQTANGDIYYGLGEGAFVSIGGTKNGTPGFVGSGVYKSTDGGNTFSKLTSTNSSAWNNVSKLGCDPTDPQRVYASNGTGFYYSDNGGTSWTRPTGQLGSSRDLQVSTNGTIYTFIGSLIYKSTDKGANLTRTEFNQSGQPSFSVGRLTLAISPEDENYVYALVSNGQGTFDGLGRTTDGGATWTKLVNGGPSYAEFFGSNGQGGYNNIITVDPLNKNRVFMAGVGMAEWDNVRGYNLIASTFATRNNPFYVHADKHEMIWDRSVNPPVLWIGTDGGMFRSGNMNDRDYGYIFSEENRGYITSQYYGVAANAAGAVMGGTQDNGTQFINGRGNTVKSAVRIFGGDGFQTEIAQSNPDVIFAESQYGAMQRSTNGGVSFADIWDNRIGNADLEVAEGTSYAPFDCQFRLWEDFQDSSNSKFFFAPYGGVWAALNPLDKANRPNWYIISTNSGNQRVTCLEPSKNGDNLFYCTAEGNLFRVDSLSVATYDTGTVKTAIPAKVSTVNIKGNLPGGRAITSIAVDPSNPNRALVTLGNYGNTGAYVYVSNNVLDPSPTWTNVTGNLPTLPVYHGIILIDNPNYFVVATEMGIWATDDNGASWELQDNGMPANVASYIIRQYEFKPWEGPVVYVGTHGRGFYRSNSFLTSVNKPRTTAQVNNITLFPNPAIGNVNVSFTATTNGEVTYKVFNLQGQQVMKVIDIVSQGKVTKNLPLSGLSKGTYIVNIKANGVNQSAKVIVQ